MPKLEVVREDSGTKEPRTTLEIHWEPKQGESKIDTYPDDSLVDIDETGLIRVTYFEDDDETGETARITVSYGYGEAKKIIQREIS